MRSQEQCVATVGVFDGVHRGHQQLIRRAVAEARETSACSVAVTFDPPPEAILKPTRDLFQITPRQVKEPLLLKGGIDRVHSVCFTLDLARMPAKDFVLQVLLAEFNLVGLVVGYDFRFGAAAAGSIPLLKELGAEHGFRVHEVAAVEAAGAPISSTRIRELLRRGGVAEAAVLLGRHFSVTGRVVSGRGIGKRELVPTANLVPDRQQLLPQDGVYLVETETAMRVHTGVASIGTAPTVAESAPRQIETHLLDFEGDLGGKQLTVRFLEWIRAEHRFPDLETLRRAIHDDIRHARERVAGSRQNRLAAQ